MHRVTLNTRIKAPCLTKLATEIVKCQSYSDDNRNGDSSKTDPTSKRPIYSPEDEVSIDNPPTTCCMSGCSNCVFIAWAEALSKKMSTADPIIAKKILEQVDDPSMQAFLRMELRNLGLIK